MKNCLRLNLFANLVVWSIVFMFGSKSEALITARVNYTGAFVNPAELNGSLFAVPSLTHTQLFGLGGDLYLTLPMFPVGLGIRYETLNRNVSNSLLGVQYSSELENQRFSVLANYRILDTGLYIGPIASLGVFHISKFKYSNPNSTSYQADNTISFSVGAEAGLKLAGLELGGELGYLYYSAIDYRSDLGGRLQNTSFRNMQIDLSGIYLKGQIGYEF
jgi:hypothetical protein